MVEHKHNIYEIERFHIPDGYLLISMRTPEFERFIKDIELCTMFRLNGRRYVIDTTDIIYEEVPDGHEVMF